MKRKRLFVVLLPVLLALGVGKLWAKDSAEDRLDLDLKSFADRVENLEKNPPFKIGLLLQTQYVHNSISGLTGNYDQFLGKRAELKISGELKPEKINYVLVYDPLQTAAKQLKDYFAKLSYVPFLDLQFGQGKYPQALEGRTPSGDLNFVNRALVSSAFGDKRDLFLQVSGSGLTSGEIKTDYALALVQGSGQNTAENNADKDLVGRGFWQWEELGFGISGYAGWEPTGVRNNFGFEGAWKSGGLKLQAEYLQGQLESGNSSSVIPAVLKLPAFPRGYYGSAQIRLEDWRFGARWESYNPDATPGSLFNTDNNVLTLGVDWFQSGDRFRIYADFEEHFTQYEAFITQVEIYL